jgi:hypothetical protein
LRSSVRRKEAVSNHMILDLHDHCDKMEDEGGISCLHEDGETAPSRPSTSSVYAIHDKYDNYGGMTTLTMSLWDAVSQELLWQADQTESTLFTRLSYCPTANKIFTCQVRNAPGILQVIHP